MILVRRDDISVSEVSDWVEITVVYSNEPLSKSKLCSLLEDNFPDHVLDDQLLDSIFQELGEREVLYGSDSPFKVDGNVIIPQVTWLERPEYFMCLLFSYLGAAKAHKGTRLFEQVSNIALSSYLDGDAVTLGFPNEGDLPSQISQVAEKLSEHRASSNPPPSAKDRGIDVIGWKGCNDKRKGQMIVLMQCAAGRNWRQKKRIMLDVWAQYINWNPYTTVPSISVAELIDKSKWSEATIEYGVVFDRARIYRYLYSRNVIIDANLRNDVIEWCDSKVKVL